MKRTIRTVVSFFARKTLVREAPCPAPTIAPQTDSDMKGEDGEEKIGTRRMTRRIRMTRTQKSGASSDSREHRYLQGLPGSQKDERVGADDG